MFSLPSYKQFLHFFSFKRRMMTRNKSGLIVNVSSVGGLRYLFNVTYGIGKVGKDRMAADCAHELKKYNVAMVSLWPGAVKTEKMMENVLGMNYQHNNFYVIIFLWIYIYSADIFHELQ